MKERLIYFDTEFTELSQKGELISIGMTTVDGITFYAEINNFNKNKLNKWIIDNVISNLKFNDKETIYYQEGKNTFVKGTSERVSQVLKYWLKQFGNIQFVSDVSHYDFMFLVELLADNALELPETISPYCHDINSDIATFLGISDRDAFNYTREDLINISNINLKDKHNSLYDAIVIKEIDMKIRKIKVGM